uniref:UPAR/Ly6 domain-containing protein n=1 Tax=Neogobius melanostomus TaxID=47308 RepID=A0A8C6S9E6_9GOBI
ELEGPGGCLDGEQQHKKTTFIFSGLTGPSDSIKCYSCQDYSGSCSKTEVCPLDDACLTLKARGGDTYRSCVRYSKCDFNILSWAFPTLSSFSYSCCNSELCLSVTANCDPCSGSGPPLFP